MKALKNYTLNLTGRLFALSEPQVMGILNATPDSFFSGSRMLGQTEDDSLQRMRQRARQIVDEGGTMIDVGAYSTRPGAPDVSPEEEMHRLSLALKACREEAPGVPVSVDTFRADVARFAVEECGAQMVNDISGGEMDRDMCRTIARLRVPYILMHMQGTPQTMQTDPQYADVTREVMTYLARRAQRLREMGVCDVIADPGFGFGKTVEHNYQMMRQLECFSEL
ncbi:MAG: dihydropteroate synthase, partial [Bacteroidaceae bacterium]|nr:dihydropteroate synthase [Bacteroidaceae bacterium]